jgi:hypothetical protein
MCLLFCAVPVVCPVQVPCVCNEFTGELLRGIRMHFTRFLDNLKDTGRPLRGSWVGRPGGGGDMMVVVVVFLVAGWGGDIMGGKGWGVGGCVAGRKSRPTLAVKMGCGDESLQHNAGVGGEAFDCLAG